MFDDIIAQEVLGYFDQSTFTIKTAFNLDVKKWPPSLRDLTTDEIRNYSNFVHEVTHYIQFSGTVFGLQYQVSQELMVSCLAGVIRSNIAEGHYSLPLGGSERLGQLSSENRGRLFEARFLVDRYNRLIAGPPQRRMWRKDTQIHPSQIRQQLNLQADISYPMAGLVAMENWATWNQRLFVSTPRIPESTRSALSREYSEGRHPDYTFINDVLASRGRNYLAPLIYWIAFNPPFEPDHLSDWVRTPEDRLVAENLDWICARVERLVEATEKLPSNREFFSKADWNADDVIWLLKSWDQIEEQLCELCGYERPRHCIDKAISNIESSTEDTWRRRPAIRITLDVLRWVTTHELVWPILLWPMGSALLGEDLARTAYLGFPLWVVKYAGQPDNSGYGHNVDRYPASFFQAFEQMRLWRRLLPVVAWGDPETSQFRCPVPKLRGCYQEQAWCCNIFQGPRPNSIDHDTCFLGISFKTQWGVEIDQIQWQGTSL